MSENNEIDPLAYAENTINIFRTKELQLIEELAQAYTLIQKLTKELENKKEAGVDK